MNNKNYKCLDKCFSSNCKCKEIQFNKKKINIDCLKNCNLKYHKNGNLLCHAKENITNKKIQLPPNFCNTYKFMMECNDKNVNKQIFNEDFNCFEILWLINGCNKNGSGYPNKNQNVNKWINKDYKYIANDIKLLKKRANSGETKAVKICYNKYNTHLDKEKCKKNPFKKNLNDDFYKPQCLQFLWKKNGCSEKGTKYPSSNLLDYQNCNSKKCNISTAKNNICWNKCSPSEISDGLFKLSLSSQNNNRENKIKCLGFESLVEGMHNKINFISKEYIITIIIIIMILLFSLIN